MAKLLEVETAPVKPGKKSLYTPIQDLFIAREVSAAKAHTPPYGETKKRFESAAIMASQHESFKDEPIARKAIQDRYKRLQEQYGELDDGNQRLSGVGGGEMGELADLLMRMREAKDDFDSQKKAVKVAERKKEEDKEIMGMALMEAATKRKASSSSEDGGDDVEDSSDDGEKTGSASSRKKRKTRLSPSMVATTKMDWFVVHLKEADLARIELEREKLAFQQYNCIADRIEREKEREQLCEERLLEREERREERLEHSMLELEKHKALLELLKKHK